MKLSHAAALLALAAASAESVQDAYFNVRVHSYNENRESKSLSVTESIKGTATYTLHSLSFT